MKGHGRLDILTIGNALLDIFCFTDDELSLSLALHPNNATHVTTERLDEILPTLPPVIYVAGGSAANAAKAASALGLSCAFAGCTGTEEREKDHWALMFERDLHEYGVHCYLESRHATTGRCLVLHMPGSLTSIACAPAAATLFRSDQIPEILIKAARVVHIDGQLLRHPALLSTIADTCKKEGIILSLDIGTTALASEYAGSVRTLLEEANCILFANDEEAMVLANRWARELPEGTFDPETRDFSAAVFTALTRGRGEFPCIVRKRGPSGSDAWSDGTVYSATTVPVPPLDATAAGDIFAGAFLSARLSNQSIPVSLRFANRAASAILQVPGSRLDKDEFAVLAKEISIPQPGL